MANASRAARPEFDTRFQGALYDLPLLRVSDGEALWSLLKDNFRIAAEVVTIGCIAFSCSPLGQFPLVDSPKMEILMRVQQPVRDRNMSLWQSAVRATLGSRDLPDDAKKRVEHGVSMHAQSEQNGQAGVPAADALQAGKAASPPSADTQASKAAFDALKAH